MKKLQLIFILLFFCVINTFSISNTDAQTVFNFINLEKTGLENVKELVEKKEFTEASKELLKYYKSRKTIKHFLVDRFNRTTKIDKIQLDRANDGLKHIFYCQRGYKSFDFGKNINWQYWPVKDNEIRWQLHRNYWWESFAKAYWNTNDEKYAKEWVFQLKDWIKKNPFGLSKENDRFAWRPLEVSRRLQDQTMFFEYFINSEYFTADFLITFLKNYHYHASRVEKNWSKRGNHLLFEAQRMIAAGSYFQEFKNAKSWRNQGIEILNREIKKQVYEDGLQYELSFNYHIGCIEIFNKALNIAKINGFENEFPQSYINTIHSMITAIYKLSFPDLTYPMFSDAKSPSSKKQLKNYKRWSKDFPKDKNLKYIATKGKKGIKPNYTSCALKNGGVYTFRSGWSKNATCMTLKASPPAFWHSQPDNGTFELMIKGRNFFPDAGCYCYGGDADRMKKRNWFRQTMVHNTLTLNNKNLTCNAQLISWKTSENLDILKYTNPSYKNLNHKRTVYFIDKKFFVFIDEAEGSATGNINLHYHLKEGEVNFNNNSVNTLYPDNNNIVIKCFSDSKIKLIKEEGWVSYKYNKKTERASFSFLTKKTDSKPIKYITIIYPYNNNIPNITAKFNGKAIDVIIDGKKIKLK